MRSPPLPVPSPGPETGVNEEVFTVARMTVFGRRTDERAADEKAADERAAARADEPAAVRADEAVRTDEQVAEKQAADQAEVDRMRIPTGRGVATVDAPPTTPATTRAPTVVERGWHGRTSGLAVLGLVFGMSAVYAALSGRLAPVGIAVGVLGLLFSVAGMAASNRPGVTGRGVALLGLLGSFVGVVFAILAINGAVSWLNGDADQFAQARDWLNNQFSWLRSW
jgi:hypothetical protein